MKTTQTLGRNVIRWCRTASLGLLLACAQATSFSTTVEAQTEIEGGGLLEHSQATWALTASSPLT